MVLMLYRLFSWGLPFLLLPAFLLGDCSDCGLEEEVLTVEEIDARMDCLRDECEKMTYLSRQTARDARRLGTRDKGEARYLRKKVEWYAQQAHLLQRQINKLQEQREHARERPFEEFTD